MAKKYFGTDGIRVAINSKHINGDMFFKFGLASGTYFKSQKKRKQIAIIAKDTRLSGYTLEPALVSGLTSAGMHVYTFGPLPTNGLAMLTKSMKANMGIMITASHNPHHDNGLKLFGPDGMKLSDQIEKKIEKKILELKKNPVSVGKFTKTLCVFGWFKNEKIHIKVIGTSKKLPYVYMVNKKPYVKPFSDILKINYDVLH